MNLNKWLPFFFLLFTITACKKDDPTPLPPSPIKNYLFLGHTYHWQDLSKVDPRLEQINLDQYDQIWLGGDLTSETTRFKSHVEYLDDLFQLNAPTTLWALGNHDTRNGNIPWIKEATGRNTFYSQHLNGITYLVIDQFLDKEELYGDQRCDLLQQQVDLITSVTDTIQQSDHLILLMHMVIWGWTESGMETQSKANADNPYWKFLCNGDSRFPELIYPLLKEVQQRGVQVSVISGDGGALSKGYHYQTTEGIDFFISGINNSLSEERRIDFDYFNYNPDSVLIFQHDTRDGSLEWEFEELNGLVR